MRTRLSRAAAAALLLVTSACTTTGSSGGASGAVAANGEDGPSLLKPTDDMIPAEVRALETQIEKRATLLADEVRIEVSRNYEWDVSLTGDDVSPQTPADGGHVSVAEGAARATFRNLDIRAKTRITFFKSGFDVQPFIRVTARGNVSYVDVHPDSGAPQVKRATLCKIDGPRLGFDDDALRAPLERPAGVRER
ncbi:MAG TPA: hypothetical protein VEI02_02890 [Planctomycetota bacterium]|nr:hypothetical protein [Planctomycetota bacterium]